MLSIRNERSDALINYLNDKIKIQPHSIKILEALSKHASTSYLYGGCVRNACYATLYEAKSNATNLLSDTDVLTTATTMQIRSEFPNLRHKAGIDLLVLHESSYAENIDIRQASSNKEIFEKNIYFDCTINSILYNLEVGLLDPS